MIVRLVKNVRTFVVDERMKAFLTGKHLEKGSLLIIKEGSEEVQYLRQPKKAVSVQYGALVYYCLVEDIADAYEPLPSKPIPDSQIKK